MISVGEKCTRQGQPKHAKAQAWAAAENTHAYLKMQACPSLTICTHLHLPCTCVRQVGPAWCQVQRGVAGVQSTAGLEESVPGHQHTVQHALPQKKVAHPLTDDDVNLPGSNSMHAKVFMYKHTYKYT